MSIDCVGCEGKPAPENNPCAVCGRTPSPSLVSGDVVEAEEVIDSWIFNLELECSGVSLNPLESVAIGGAVLRMDELLSALKALRSAREQGNG